MALRAVTITMGLAELITRCLGPILRGLVTILKEAMTNPTTAMTPLVSRGEALAAVDFGDGRGAMGMEGATMLVGIQTIGIRVADLWVAVIKAVDMGNLAEGLEALATW